MCSAVRRRMLSKGTVSSPVEGAAGAPASLRAIGSVSSGPGRARATGGSRGGGGVGPGGGGAGRDGATGSRDGGGLGGAAGCGGAAACAGGAEVVAGGAAEVVVVAPAPSEITARRVPTSAVSPSWT